MAERPKPARGNAKPSANPRGRAQEIYAQLRQLLLVGGWPLFERLVEVRLANRFGTSRTPIREALLRLEAEGLIERRGGDGFYPKVPNLPAVKQLYEVRKILELGALRLPGESGGRHDQKRLAELRDEWLEILERPPVADPDFVLNDERFHLTLVAAAGNQAIVDHLRLVNEQIRIVRMHEFIDPDRTAWTARQHLAILDAVLAEEIEEAVELLSSHIDEVAKEAAARTVRALERMIAPAAHGGSERPAAATTDLQPGAEAGINQLGTAACPWKQASYSQVGGGKRCPLDRGAGGKRPQLRPRQVRWSERQGPVATLLTVSALLDRGRRLAAKSGTMPSTRMDTEARVRRPPTPEGFDHSRAAERAADPQGWRLGEEQISAIYDVIAKRRDIRRFRPDPVPPQLVEKVLGAAHLAPSVGFMQPWRFIVIRDPATKAAVRRLAQRERLRQAPKFGARAGHFLDQKIEGIVEAPVGICVCCDHGDPEIEVLGRGTIPQTDLYSTACAIQNLWLAARAEGLGVGWVSFYRPEDLRALLGLPERVDPVAYLCLGWPDERPPRPGLESSGWASRLPLEAVVMQERWAQQAPQSTTDKQELSPRLNANLQAATAVRDRFDRLLKPAGALGALEPTLERWASVTGRPLTPPLRAGVLVACADHGHTARGTTLFESSLSAQIAAAAARGESAVGVLARRGGHTLLVADVGLRGPTPSGVADYKLAEGTKDMVEEAAVGGKLLERALALGRDLCRHLAEAGCHCLVTGEVGLGNTTTAAALLCALSGCNAAEAVGRGTGMDAKGLERKRAVVDQALTRHGHHLGPLEALSAMGGLELAVLAGACLEAATLRLPVLLDGFATSVAALAAVGIEPTVGELLFAGHRSAEPGHQIALLELGLEPILDLRLRLGEGSGALLALPTLEAAAALFGQMGTFAEDEH